MAWLPQFLYATSNTNKHLEILVNRLRTLNANAQPPESPIKNIFDSLTLLSNAMQRKITILTSKDIVNYINNLLIQIGRAKADANFRDYNITLNEIVATLGTLCYEQRKTFNQGLLFDSAEDENEENLARVKYRSAFTFLYPHEMPNIAALRNIYSNFKLHFLAAKDKRNSGIVGTGFGSVLTLGIVLITGGPLWLLICAPLLCGFIGAHLMEYRSIRTYKPYVFTPEPDAIVGGSSAHMGPLNPDPNRAPCFSGQAYRLGQEYPADPEGSETEETAKRAASVPTDTPPAAPGGPSSPLRRITI